MPDTDWLRRLLPLGIRTVQLRLKDKSKKIVLSEIRTAKDLTREHNCRLIINDYWAEAIDVGVNYIHLGQEDLDRADLSAINDAGISLGISTHDEAELERALALKPDYIALGPIYETKLKEMKWRPQGLENIKVWKSKIGNVPLVAIGGITIARAGPILSAGAQVVSVITDFLTHDVPEKRVVEWLEWAKTVRQSARTGTIIE